MRNSLGIFTFSMANPAMVSTLVAHLQNFCWHSTKRQFYLLDGQAWYWTHVVGNDDMVCTCSCLDNQGIWLRGRQVHSETLQKGNSSCKSHLPWCTVDTKHLKASFLDNCWNKNLFSAACTIFISEIMYIPTNNICLSHYFYSLGL